MNYSRNIKVSDHLLILSQPVAFDLDWPPTGVPGFVTFGDGGAIIKTGVSGGCISLDLYLLDDAPPLDIDSWEDVDEGDVATEDGSLRITAGLDATNLVPGGEAGLTPEGPSLHRVRISANGRADNYDMVTLTDTITEAYLIQIWPATAPSNAIVHKHTSRR